MDRKLRQRLMEAVAFAGGASVFRSHGGIRDLLDNRLVGLSDPVEIAAHMLDYLCLEDGRFNGFLSGVQVAIAFLDATLTKPTDDSQRRQLLVDLRRLMEGGTTIDQLCSWARTWYL